MIFFVFWRANVFLDQYVFADVTKDKVQCFLNRISAVYSNIDSEFIHDNQIGR